MRLLLVTRKSLVEILREPKLLLLVLLTPLAFLGITMASYSYPLLVTYPLLVINTAPAGAELIEELAAQRYTDDRHVFEVAPATDRVAPEIALKEKTSETPRLKATPPGVAVN